MMVKPPPSKDFFSLNTLQPFDFKLQGVVLWVGFRTIKILISWAYFMKQGFLHIVPSVAVRRLVVPPVAASLQSPHGKLPGRQKLPGENGKEEGEGKSGRNFVPQSC